MPRPDNNSALPRHQPHHHHDHRRVQILLGLAFLALLATTLVLYWPGLSGPFVMDDEPNLQSLRYVGFDPTPERVLRFVLDGYASSIGRPLALASFLLNDITWPSDPWGFKYTNLLIHLLTGCLIFWLFLRLVRLAGCSETKAQILSLLVTSLWLLHPFNTSTVLYVVQRMAQLSALFTVAGLLCFVRGREIVAFQPRAGYAWMSVGIAVGGILATLNKEIGILLPLYALVIEFTLLRPAGLRVPDHWKAWAFIFLYLPLLLLAGYLALSIESQFNPYRKRDFDAADRLLSQPRVLLTYLLHILTFRRGGTGVFHDDVLASRGLLDPLTTLPALAVTIGFAASAIWLRRLAPVYAFAVLWFFGGHLLESGVVSLELYFEHRNYLPMLGPLFALAYYALHVPAKLRRITAAAAVALLGLAALVTWQNARLWGDPVVLAYTWAAEHPRSVRAQQLAAHYWARIGELDRAEENLRRVLHYHPHSSAAHIQLLQLECMRGARILPELVRRTAREIRTGARETATAESFQEIARMHARGNCRGLQLDDLELLIDSLIANPAFRGSGDLSRLYYLKAIVHRAQRNFDAMIRALQRSYVLEPKVDVALTEAQYLISAGLFDDARIAIERAVEADQAAGIARGVRAGEIQSWADALDRLEASEHQPDVR